MPEPEDIFPDDQAKLPQIVAKILTYQESLADGRAVDLDELKREHILSTEDLEYLSTHSVAYKPRKSAAYKRGQHVLKMDTGHGYVAVGLKGTHGEHKAFVRELPLVIEKLLRIPETDDERQLHIKFSEGDGVGVFPGLVIFNLKSESWRERLPAIRNAASELGLTAMQDYECQGSRALIYAIPRNAADASAAVLALLDRGCGITDSEEISYLAPALDDE